MDKQNNKDIQTDNACVNKTTVLNWVQDVCQSEQHQTGTLDGHQNKPIVYSTPVKMEHAAEHAICLGKQDVDDARTISSIVTTPVKYPTQHPYSSFGTTNASTLWMENDTSKHQLSVRSIDAEDPRHWTPTQVAEWLHTRVGIAQEYCAEFEAQEVDGQVLLMDIDETVLKEELNIVRLGPRKRIWRAILTLREKLASMTQSNQSMDIDILPAEVEPVQRKRPIQDVMEEDRLWTNKLTTPLTICKSMMYDGSTETLAHFRPYYEIYGLTDTPNTAQSDVQRPVKLAKRELPTGRHTGKAPKTSASIAAKHKDADKKQWLPDYAMQAIKLDLTNDMHLDQDESDESDAFSFYRRRSERGKYFYKVIFVTFNLLLLKARCLVHLNLFR
jgi:hypothetical protein